MSNDGSNDASQPTKRANPDNDAAPSPWTPCPATFIPNKRPRSNTSERPMTSAAPSSTSFPASATAPPASLLHSSSLANSTALTAVEPFSSSSFCHSFKDLDPSHSSECFTALHAAQLRLSSARQNYTACAASLKMARDRFAQSQVEVREALRFYEGVERRWGVIDVDLEEDGGGDGDAAASVSVSESSNEFLDVDASAEKSFPSQDENSSNEPQAEGPEAVVQHAFPRYEIRNAGDIILNGSYHLCKSNHHDDAPIYVSSNGPISLQQKLYDSCLFRKDGYGDKVRWCLGLVPRVDDAVADSPLPTDNMSHGNTSNDGTSAHNHNKWNFALAHIYYWVEIPVHAENSKEPPMNGWRACHGRRPVPSAERGGFVENPPRGVWNRLCHFAKRLVGDAGEI